ncbi:hypothetical protein DAEQUDRAFT_670793 [Daedalea quercina L-15889]|uniref:Vps72/YL1 C-terminal domain-containing protein n=1 Tax=Daedalea quercina L-15889 TaxID=1314783 RepID=A0A165PZT0_9APHY|nr:hypothetical protein DAEQUDRAFT_670793 [Daedalea quercina L-15889]
MADNADSLVTRRSKRSTAGNRMEAALAEFRAEDVGMDVEEDVDFVMERGDAFESDFESTDEEAQAQEELGVLEERKDWEDERRPRKASRSRLDRVTAAAHERHKASFNPQLQEHGVAEHSSVRAKRRVSVGSVINAETGEVVEGSKRQSRRSHTMQNTSETAIRLKDAEEKKSALPKKAKTPMRTPTQHELIERALRMEEGNIKEHREYLSTEEEKRKKARLVRTSVQGPLIRWFSKAEEVTVRVDPLPPPAPPSYTLTPVPYRYYVPPSQAASPSVASPFAANATPHRSFLHVSATYHADLQRSTSSASIPLQPHSPSYAANPQAQYASPDAQSQPPTPYGHSGGSQSASYQPPEQSSSVPYSQPTPYAYPHYYYHQQYTQPHRAPSPAQPTERTEKVAKNYVVHELSQQERQQPPWHLTMKAMFGDHVKWEELRVYTSKGRPLCRPVLHCPITGKVAHYLDPRTNVPFADIAAYETLSKILEHEFVWSDSLGCYVG